MEKKKLLQILHDYNKENPGSFLNGRKISKDLSIDFKDICVTAFYLKDKKLIKMEEQNEIGRKGLLDFRAKISADGIDSIELQTTMTVKEKTTNRSDNNKYEIALSFAGEDRAYVEEVANYLQKKNIDVFYDRSEQVDLWGKDLYEHLDEVYRKKSKFCVIFISQHYASKLWANHERKSAQARAFKENQEYILPVRFDDTEIPGVLDTTGYIDLRETNANELGKMIMEKLGKAPSNKKNSFRKPKIIQKKSFNPYDEALKFIDLIASTVKNRCNALFMQGISATVFNNNGKTCLRVLLDSNTIYSLDIWLGGIGKDSSISFHSQTGEFSITSSNSYSAWGDIVWNSEKDCMIFSLFNLGLFDSHTADQILFEKEEFLNKLWDKICDLIELTGRNIK